MTDMSALWLPIVVSAVIVFVVSSIIHMMLPWHKNDYGKLPREDEFRAAVRPLAIPPGDYMVPRPGTREEMKASGFMDKLKEGPVVILTVMPNRMMAMGKTMGFWFLYLIVVSAFGAFVAGIALPPGAPSDRVRLSVGVPVFMAHAMGLWSMSIWYQRAMSTTLKATIDSVIYAAVTAYIIAWLWPH